MKADGMLPMLASTFSSNKVKSPEPTKESYAVAARSSMLAPDDEPNDAHPDDGAIAWLAFDGCWEPFRDRDKFCADGAGLGDERGAWFMLWLCSCDLFGFGTRT